MENFSFFRKLISKYTEVRFAYLFKINGIIVFCFFSVSNLYAEGTKQISPTSNDRVNLSLNNSDYNSFGRYDGADDQRLYVHIDDPVNEQLFLGFSRPVSGGNYPCSGGYIDGYFRIKDPGGNIVFGPQLLSSATSPITSWGQASNGPNQIVGSGGYNAFSFSPAAAGDYYVEFSRSANSNGADLYIEWWDITVATTGGSPTAIDGRVFARNWAFYTPPINCSGGSFGCSSPNQFGAFDRPFNGSFHIYSDVDSVVTKIDFDGAGFQPVAFNVFFNDSGTGSTGNVINDRKSLEGTLAGTALYPLFLNDPDLNVYPSGTFGTYDGDPFIVSCDGQSGQFFVTVTKAGQVDLLIDLDQTSGSFLYDPGTADIALAIKIEPMLGESSPYTRAISWDGIDGLGNQVDLLNPFDYQMTYTQGAFHLPVFDAEFMANGFTFQTIRPTPPPGANPVNIYYDDSDISDSNLNGSPKIQLNGCSAPCHTWNNGCYGDVNTINTWFFGSEDKKQENQAAICLVEAIDDAENAIENVAVTVDVLQNDNGIAIDTAAITTTGVLQPSNGSIQGIDPVTGEITYLSNVGFAGTDQFEYILCDTGMFVCDTALVSITVTIPNPPVISNHNSDPTASTTFLEDDIAPVDDYDANDADGETENGGGLTWSITNGPDNDDLTIDPNTGLLTFNSPPDYENPTDSDLDNFYTVEVTVTDALGLMDVQVLTIEVLNGPDPEICGNGMDEDLDGLIDCDDPDVFFDPLLPDTDGDGIPDCCDNCTDDRDMDGIVDCEDIDPTGFFYYEHTGEIIPGATIVVQEVNTGSSANVNLILDGSTGMYQWTVSVPGTYEMIITPPTDWLFSNNCLPQDPPPYDPTGMTDPVSLGAGENGTTGFLTSNACTGYYLSFDLEAVDPLVINNNIPLIPTTEISCSDGIDNDEDGLIDCDDPDCQPMVTLLGDCSGLAVLNPEPDWTFQWLRNGSPIATATNSFYVPSPAIFGEYSVEVTSQNGCVTISSGVIACCNPTSLGVGGN